MKTINLSSAEACAISHVIQVYIKEIVGDSDKSLEICQLENIAEELCLHAMDTLEPSDFGSICREIHYRYL